jgi:hypothetical protein
MDTEIWQQLLSLESRDIVAKWFEKIHGRELNARRAKEIGASARQAREYFRNSAAANNSVRPLLYVNSVRKHASPAVAERVDHRRASRAVEIVELRSWAIEIASVVEDADAFDKLFRRPMRQEARDMR